MKRQIITIFLISMVLTACGKKSKELVPAPTTDSSVSIVEETEISETEESIIFDESQITMHQEYDEQLELIADSYDEWCAKLDEIWGMDLWKLAVTDLNRNGRLELLLSFANGMGVYSTSVIYEVDEDYNSLVMLKTKDGNEYDVFGDFTCMDEIACYKKDDTYYYEIEDYFSNGWSHKGSIYYSYCFNEIFQDDVIGGYTVWPGDEDYSSDNTTYNVYIRFRATDNTTLQSEEEYNEYMRDYWKGYEKQPNVKLEWVDLPEKIECKDALQKSFAGYNVSSSEKDIPLSDCHVLLDSVYEDAQKVIVYTD